MLCTAPMLRPPDMSKEFFYLLMLVQEDLGHFWNKRVMTRGVIQLHTQVARQTQLRVSMLQQSLKTSVCC